MYIYSIDEDSRLRILITGYPHNVDNTLTTLG